MSQKHILLMAIKENNEIITTKEALKMGIYKDTLKQLIIENKIVKIDADISYKLIKLTPIRKNDEYEDFCATIRCLFGKINAILNIDITTGDIITLKEIKYSYF